MSQRLIVLPEAEEEMLQAMRCYENQRSGLGLQFVGVVEHALVRIVEAPESFAAWSADDRYRRAVLDRFPYVVVGKRSSSEATVMLLVLLLGYAPSM